ncbi:hypothetical protein VUR80DRAFT_6804 [Thermomyces stellatus]
MRDAKAIARSDPASSADLIEAHWPYEVSSRAATRDRNVLPGCVRPRVGGQLALAVSGVSSGPVKRFRWPRPHQADNLPAAGAAPFKEYARGSLASVEIAAILGYTTPHKDLSSTKKAAQEEMGKYGSAFRLRIVRHRPSLSSTTRACLPNPGPPLKPLLPAANVTIVSVEIFLARGSVKHCPEQGSYKSPRHVSFQA